MVGVGGVGWESRALWSKLASGSGMPETIDQAFATQGRWWVLVIPLSSYVKRNPKKECATGLWHNEQFG